MSPQKQAELARQKQAQQLETLNRVNQTISAELDVQKVVQAVTDAGVELTGAQFGAFFYTLPDHNGSLLNLYALSGAPPEAFAHYPMPHMTAVFGPTFRNEGVVRSDDITQDALYGQNAPYHGMLPGHLPVRSYLAVPVVTREGTAIGGFFFGHPEAGIFNDTAERAALSLATQAAIALNNAQLYQTARHSERRFRSLVEATSQIVWNRASTGEVIVEQPAWQNFTGQTAEQQLGWGWLDAIHPDDRERTQLAWKQAVNTQALYRVEHRLRRHDGAYRFMRARATPVRNEDGTLLEWVGVHEDITEHHEAEQRLREREARYRALVEYTIVGVTRIDLNGHFIDVNPAAAAFLGYSQAELAGMSVKDVTYPPDLNESFAALQTVISGERAAVTLEKRYVRKNREIVWSNSGVTVVRGADGEPQYLIAVISNITERKHAEAELHRLNADLESRVRERTQDLAQERSFLRALLESLAEGIAVCDEHGQLTLFNDSAVRIVGLPAESLPPSEWASHYGVYHPDGITLLATEELPLLRALQGEDVRDVPIIIDTEDRPRRFVSISGNVIRGESGEKLGAVVAMHDVTAQQLAEQEVRRVNQELQRSNAELAQFAAVASHDLKSPLRTITSYLQLLERRYQGKLDAQGEQMISFTVEAAKRMDTLIDDLLAYSRLGRERRVRRVDAGQVLQDVLGNLDATIQELNAKVTWSDVPEVIADETQLRQVFQNLVANALKFQPPGRVPEVDVQAIREGDLVRFQVRDNGIGVDPAYFDRIFGIFQRLHGNKQFSGSGIGLAVVKKIIEEHDGSIWVESVVGEGTTFHFTLPVT
ncbi:PAS domain S-box protein [Deinococcus peraridilitoris]|uniref:PAS domain S-box protein n=1 Tax=Deinococcus peraridilitoris TaxID=432329 RepID=UPI001FE2336D|nr:PAS domain S-box protein [Deinococcus peraridilitoris]